MENQENRKDKVNTDADGNAVEIPPSFGYRLAERSSSERWGKRAFFFETEKPSARRISRLRWRGYPVCLAGMARWISEREISLSGSSSKALSPEEFRRSAFQTPKDLERECLLYKWKAFQSTIQYFGFFNSMIEIISQPLLMEYDHEPLSIAPPQ